MTHVAAMLEPSVREWLVRRLGHPAGPPFFVAQSMSEVWGVALTDGRRVAVKRRGGGDRLAIAAAAHRAAQAAGVDTPALLAGPDPAGDERWLTAELWRPEEVSVPEGDAPVLYAALLARVIAALADVDAAGLEPPPWADYAHRGAGRVWPPAASSRWDPHRIEADLPPALVVTARAARARLLASDLPRVLGHADLNGHNVKWDGQHPVVHDWDSIALVPEAVLVGILAADHVARPEAGGVADLGAGERAIGAYERARGRELDGDEREVAWAASAWIACYNAAFEHLHGAAGPVTAQILRDGADRLALAGVRP